MFSYHGPRMFTACQLHYHPPSSFFRLPVPLHESFFRGPSLRRSPIPESANRNWPGTCLRAASLPSDENGLKSSEGLGFRLPGTEVERNHEKGHSTRQRVLSSVCLRPLSFPRTILCRCCRPPSSATIFRLVPNFRANSLPPTSSTLRVTNESPRGYGSMILLIRVEVIGNFCFDRR